MVVESAVYMYCVWPLHTSGELQTRVSERCGNGVLDLLECGCGRCRGKRAAKEIEIEKKIIKIQYIICLALTMSDFGWGSRKFICHTHAHTHPLTHSLSQVAIYLQNWIKKTRNLLNLIFFSSFSFNLILFFVLMSGCGFNRWWCWFKAIYSNVRRNTVSGGTYMFMYVCMYRMWCSIIDYTFVLWSRLVSSRSDRL